MLCSPTACGKAEGFLARAFIHFDSATNARKTSNLATPAQGGSQQAVARVLRANAIRLARWVQALDGYTRSTTRLRHTVRNLWI